MNTNYEFNDRKKVGIDGELLIAAYLSPNWTVTKAGRDLQKQGVDLVLSSKNGDGGSYTIEVKTDTKATETGNAFIEIASTKSQVGWAMSCRADYLFYFLPQSLLIYILSPKKIYLHLLRWRASYPVVSVPNKGLFENYVTKGILVPLFELEKLGKVLNL